MSFCKPQQYKARVSDKYYLTDNKRFLLVKLELVSPYRIEFVAGQYVSLKINPAGERRSYSIASDPKVEHGVTIVVELVKEGKGSNYLGNLKLGQEVEMLGPMGKFTIYNGGARQLTKTERKYLFVATGSGIVPIYAMINDLLINKNETGAVRLHWGLREEKDIFWFDNFLRLSEEHPNFVFDPVLSRPGNEWELCTGHVQDCLRRDFTSAGSVQVGLSEWEGYVCGGQKMVEETVAVLKELKMNENKINYERFV